MLKIAFCDDDLEILKELGILLDKYKKERDEDLTCTVFQSPLELLAAIEKGFSFDILFLDILMPGENGIETAKEIRQYDNNMMNIVKVSLPEKSYLISGVCSTVLYGRGIFLSVKASLGGKLFPADGFRACRVHKDTGKQSDSAEQRRNYKN